MSIEVVLLTILLVMAFLAVIGVSSLGGLASTFMLARMPVTKARRMVP